MTSTSDLELQAHEINHVSWFCTYKFLTLCDRRRAELAAAIDQSGAESGRCRSESGHSRSKSGSSRAVSGRRASELAAVERRAAKLCRFPPTAAAFRSTATLHKVCMPFSEGCSCRCRTVFRSGVHLWATIHVTRPHLASFPSLHRSYLRLQYE